MNKNCPEILQMRRDIEISVERNINTPADFEFLSGVIWERTKTSISTSTLKRLWGYIDGADNTRQCTLELLSKTLGYKSWKEYTEHLVETNPNQSDFLTQNKHICSDDLSIGDLLVLRLSITRWEWLSVSIWRKILAYHTERLRVGPVNCLSLPVMTSIIPPSMCVLLLR